MFLKKIEEYKKEKIPIAYVDESGFAHSMPRTHGYSRMGKGCYGSCDWNARGRKNWTFDKIFSLAKSGIS